MSDSIRNQLETAAVQPQRVRTDAGEVEQHDLKQLIEADKYLAAQAAATATTTNKRRGLRFNKLIPPGSLD
jgi:ribosomal protein L12E/L44/L45/RPP1/RPP2